jgi:hypothetical protein
MIDNMETGNEIPDIEMPDFAALFGVCSCRRKTCSTCSGFQLTPRTAAVLWSMAQILADRGYDDVEEHRSEIIATRSDWSLFDRYPRITWAQDATWRRQAARSYDDLAADFAHGGWPLPTCPAEEMALHLILDDAPPALDDGWTGIGEAKLASLPEHPEDFNWDEMADVFFQDFDILNLMDPELDGIDDPHDKLNSQMAMGDYRPTAWFVSFQNMPARDPQRGFRR